MDVKDLPKNTLQIHEIKQRVKPVLLYHIKTGRYFLFNFNNRFYSNSTFVFPGISEHGDYIKVRDNEWDYLGDTLYMTNLSSYMDIESIKSLTATDRKYLEKVKRDIYNRLNGSAKYRALMNENNRENEGH